MMAKDIWIGVAAFAVLALLCAALYMSSHPYPFAASTSSAPQTEARNVPILNSFGIVAAANAKQFSFKDQFGAPVVVTLGSSTTVVEGITAKHWGDIVVGTLVSVAGDKVTIIPPPPKPVGH